MLVISRKQQSDSAKDGKSNRSGDDSSAMHRRE